MLPPPNQTHVNATNAVNAERQTPNADHGIHHSVGRKSTGIGLPKAVPLRPGQATRIWHPLGTLCTIGLLFLTPSAPALTIDQSRAQTTPPPLSAATPNSAQLASSDINREIERVLTGPEYAWHKPAGSPAAPGWTRHLEDWIQENSAALGRAIGRLMKALEKWFQGLVPHFHPGDGNKGTDTLSLTVQVLAWATILVAVAVLALILARLLRRKATARPSDLSGPPPVPDLASETTTADELPEDEWLQLSRERAAQGDFRQAVRALFFAALSLLASEGLVLARKSKSNFDYERELKRKTSSAPDVVDIFSDGRKLFERSWYGAHRATVAEFEQSLSLYEGLRHASLHFSQAQRGPFSKERNPVRNAGYA
jgi:hypothetical protein